MQLYRLRVEYQLQNKESGQMYCIKRKKKKKRRTNIKHQARLVLCIKVALNSLKTNQPGKLSSREENTCFLFYAFALTSMFSPFHLDRELGCPSPECNVPDLGRLFYVNTNSSL